MIDFYERRIPRWMGNERSTQPFELEVRRASGSEMLRWRRRLRRFWEDFEAQRPAIDDSEESIAAIADWEAAAAAGVAGAFEGMVRGPVAATIVGSTEIAAGDFAALCRAAGWQFDPELRLVDELVRLVTETNEIRSRLTEAQEAELVAKVEAARAAAVEAARGNFSGRPGGSATTEPGTAPTDASSLPTAAPAAAAP